MNRLLVVTAALALPIAVTSCSNSKPSPSSLNTPSATPTPTTPTPTPVTGNDKTRAAAIQVHLADLPDGWKAQKITTTAAKQRAEDAAFDKCLSVPTVEDVETTSSDVEFGRSDGFAFVDGLINVTKTEEQAQQYQTALAGSKAVTCAVSNARKFLTAPAGAKIVSITGSKLDVPGGGIGIRSVVTLQFKNGRKVSITSDDYGIVVKRFVIQATFTGVIQPMQQTFELGVVTKVFTRALASAA